MTEVNQQVIADRLNISRTTVSRSFSNHPAINPETRARVLEMAAQLGYRYSTPRTRKGRPASKSTTIGVLIGIPRLSGTMAETFQEMLRGISERASASSDLTLDVRYHDPATVLIDPETGRLPRGFRNSQWRGAILIHPFAEEAVVRLARKISAVSIIEDYADTRVDCIDTGQNDSIFAIVRHLHELGHRRIGFLSWRYNVETPWVFRRFGAYVEALYRLGLRFDPRHTINVDPEDHMDPVAASRRVVAWRADGVTAWVCSADHQAYQMITDLREAGISVPGDLSVTGYDGITPPAGLPQLTSIEVPYHDMGISAVMRLLSRIENPAAPRRHILVAGRLIEGDTTAKPAGMAAMAKA